MGGGLTILVILAATVGLLAEPYAHLIDAELPESTLAMSLGLAAAAVGLLAGWLVPAERLLGPTVEAARSGFRIGDGWMDWAVGPALAVARWCDGIDDGIHAAVLGGGRAALSIARIAHRTDDGIHAAVLGGGRAALSMARMAHRTDERVHDGVILTGRSTMDVARSAEDLDVSGIDGAIRALVTRTLALGGRARQLQSGLVHRELLLTAGGTAVILILVLIV